MIVRAGPPFGGMVTNKVVVSLLVDFTELVVPISTLLLEEVDINFDVVDGVVVAVGVEMMLAVGEVLRFDVLGVSNVAVVLIP
jgi:hypothetical protein